MNTATIMLIVQQLVVLIPLAVDGFGTAREIIELLGEKLQLWSDEGREPTDAEWAEINAMTESLSADLNDTSRDVPEGLGMPPLDAS